MTLFYPFSFNPETTGPGGNRESRCWKGSVSSWRTNGRRQWGREPLFQEWLDSGGERNVGFGDVGPRRTTLRAQM